MSDLFVSYAYTTDTGGTGFGNAVMGGRAEPSSHVEVILLEDDLLQHIKCEYATKDDYVVTEVVILNYRKMVG